MPLLYYDRMDFSFNAVAYIYKPMTSAKQKCCMNIIEYSGIFTHVRVGFSNQCSFMDAAFLAIANILFEIFQISSIYKIFTIATYMYRSVKVVR